MSIKMLLKRKRLGSVVTALQKKDHESALATCIEIAKDRGYRDFLSFLPLKALDATQNDLLEDMLTHAFHMYGYRAEIRFGDDVTEVGFMRKFDERGDALLSKIKITEASAYRDIVTFLELLDEIDRGVLNKLMTLVLRGAAIAAGYVAGKSVKHGSLSMKSVGAHSSHLVELVSYDFVYIGSLLWMLETNDCFDIMFCRAHALRYLLSFLEGGNLDKWSVSLVCRRVRKMMVDAEKLRDVSFKHPLGRLAKVLLMTELDRANAMKVAQLCDDKSSLTELVASSIISIRGKLALGLSSAVYSLLTENRVEERENTWKEHMGDFTMPSSDDPQAALEDLARQVSPRNNGARRKPKYELALTFHPDKPENWPPGVDIGAIRYVNCLNKKDTESAFHCMDQAF